MIRVILFVLISTMFAALSPSTSAADKTPLRFGYVTVEMPTLTQQRLTPLINYLSDALGRRVELVVLPSIENIVIAIAKNDVDIAFLTPVAYVRAHSAASAKIIVKAVNDQQPSFKAMIVSADGNGINTVRDLAGKRFAFADPAALLQNAIIASAGLQLEQLGHYDHLGHADNVIRGILNKEYDAGIVNDETAYRWQGKGIRILFTSPDLPSHNISAGSGVDDATIDRLRQALLALTLDSPRHRPMITSLGSRITSFAAGSDADYDTVRSLIAPFKR